MQNRPEFRDRNGLIDVEGKFVAWAGEQMWQSSSSDGSKLCLSLSLDLNHCFDLFLSGRT